MDEAKANKEGEARKPHRSHAALHAAGGSVSGRRREEGRRGGRGEGRKSKHLTSALR